MTLNIIKRNGQKEAFNKQKIINAINKAMIEVDGDLYETETAESIAQDILDYGPNPLTVEEIQDMVEYLLMDSERKDVARAYVRYRYKKEIARNKSLELRKAIDAKIRGINIENQNANVDERSFGGRYGEAADLVFKEYALEICVSEMARNNHRNNEIYIHDLSSYAVGMHNCLSVPFDDLLKHGFNTRQTDVRPANSINTAFQLVAVIFQLQSLQQFGGVSATHLDWTMVPYVRKSFYKHFKNGAKYVARVDYDMEEYLKNNNELSLDYPSLQQNYPKTYNYAMDMTVKELEQAVEGMYHNLNTLQSRSGNQLPFTSINYGTCTLPEGRMVIKALLEGSIKGIGKLHKTSIFPCGIFQCMTGVNRKPGDPNYDLFQLALKSTAQRLYPNYANVDWSGNAGYDVNDPTTYFSTMGCRTANGWDINGFGQKKDGRGNICPVTIIMPTLAMEAKEYWEKFPSGDDSCVETFMDLLNEKIYEAKDMLIERFEWICSQNPASAKFMYENGLMAGYIPEEGIRSALKHGTLALGQLGLAETLQILIGCDHTEPEGMELAKELKNYLKTNVLNLKKNIN